MCGSKLFWSLLLALFLSLSVYGQATKSPSPSAQPALSSPSVPAPAGMTDAEIVEELMSNLEKREASIAERESLADKREARLTEREAALKTREENWAEREEISEQRKKWLTETEAYWKNYKSDTLKDKIAAGLIGFALGYAGGNYTGFRIGVTVPVR